MPVQKIQIVCVLEQRFSLLISLILQEEGLDLPGKEIGKVRRQDEYFSMVEKEGASCTRTENS